MSKCFLTSILILFITSCSKPDNTNPIEEAMDDQTYVILANNLNIEEDAALTIKTSLTAERTFTAFRDSITKIIVRAAEGEYIKFTVKNVTGCTFRVQDSKGSIIADYVSLPGLSNKTVELDFIAYPPDDPKKDFLQYKTGLAKLAGDHLIGKKYLLKERYYLENDIKTDNAQIQHECSFSDVYRFVPLPAEIGNFSPERLLFKPEIDANQGSCTYNSPSPIYIGTISIIQNSSDSLSFPIWDPASIDGAQSMIFRTLFIDSINASGALTIHRSVSSNKNEVFVYSPQ